jgi:hypothetical protein
MIKFRPNSSPGWFAAGVAVAVLLVPAAVGASTILQIAGVVHISGSSAFPSSSNDAQVSQAGQILSTTATPHYYYLLATDFASTSVHVIAAPPKGSALIVTSIHVDANPKSPVPEEFLAWVSRTACTGPALLSVDRVVTDSSGETVLPYEPGVAIPSSDVLCGELDNIGGGSGAGNTTVVGYSVPASSVQSPG